MDYEQRKEIWKAVRQGAVDTLKWFSSLTGNAPTAHDKWAMHFTSNRENNTSLYQIGQQFRNLRPLTERLINIYHASSQSRNTSGALAGVREIVEARNAHFYRGSGNSRRADAGQVMHGSDARAQVESSHAFASSSARSHVSPAPSHVSRETGGGALP